MVKKILLTLIGLSFVIILVTAWIKDAFTTGDWSPVFSTFYLYFNICLQIGDYWIQNVDNYRKDIVMHGYSFFKGVLNNLDFVFRQFGIHFFYNEYFEDIINAPQDNYINIGYISKFNAFTTWIYFFYLDFKEWGVIIGSIIWGWFTGIVEKHTLLYPNIYKVAVYLLLLQCTFKCFVRWEFNVEAYVLAFIYMRFLLKKYSIRNYKNEK